MSIKILIIDDEPDVVMYLVTVLKANGFEPLSSTDPELGLQLAAKEKPDLICLDIMMPEKSGISIYIRLKKDRQLRKIPVLIVSGVSQEKDFDFRSYVADKSIPPPERYLEKPIVIDQFLQIVKDLTSPGTSVGKGKAG